MGRVTLIFSLSLDGYRGTGGKGVQYRKGKCSFPSVSLPGVRNCSIHRIRAIVDRAEKSSPASVQGKVQIPCSACQNLHLHIPDQLPSGNHIQRHRPHLQRVCWAAQAVAESWAEAVGKSHVCRREIAAFQHESHSWLEKKG